MNPHRQFAHVVVVSVLASFGSGCAHRLVAVTPEVRDLKDRGNGVVAIATSHDDHSSNVTLCSGALVSPNLVLTARHCISKAITNTPSCDSQGHSHNGAHLGDDADPASISIYVGEHVRVDVDRPHARAMKILHPKGKVLCDADVAYIVLDQPITDARILPIRLYDSVRSGDVVQPVGFGGGRMNVIGDRQPRAKSEVLLVGPALNTKTGAVLGPREFEVSEATCRGDSGGPAIDVHSGEVVGVISRGGSCISKGNHVYTRVDAYKKLAAAAFRAAEHTAASLALRDNDVDESSEL